MSSDSDSDRLSTPLPSGTYAIWTGDHESLLSTYRSHDCSIVITGDALPLQWDVLFDSGKQLYAIKMHSQQLYIVADGTDFVIADTAQFFDIKPKSQREDGEISYEISTTDNRLLQYKGEKSLTTGFSNRVTSTNAKNVPPPLWVFEELDSRLPLPQTPYSIYSMNSDYFEYSEDQRLLPRFGLKDDSPDRWHNLKDVIRRLNEEAKGSVLYKLIFLARHGQGLNNIALKDKEKLGDDDKGFLEMDPALTQEGFLQVSNIRDMWITESSLKNGGIGIPQISYCSPLTRCLVTNSITFSPQLQVKASDVGPKINTTVVENCREAIYTESERRRTKSYIELVFPKFGIEPGFAAGPDPLWSGITTESVQSVDDRAQAVVDRIFKSEPKEKTFVSITAHHEINGAIISALGGDPRAFPRHTGGVVPLICQYTPSLGALDDGFYKIEYESNSSLFADAIQIDKPVMALNEKVCKPTTWFVKCVDAKEQVYIINYFYRQTHGMPKPKSYWNTPPQGFNTQNFDVPVILSYKERGWRLIPSDKSGVFYIEWIPDSSSTPDSHSGSSLVNVESNCNAKGKPGLVLQNVNSIGPGSPRWRFVPVKFPWSFCVNEPEVIMRSLGMRTATSFISEIPKY